MTDDEINSSFYTSLIADIIAADPWSQGHRPLLAHYTSILSMEQILIKKAVLFSNPLFMNDLEEMKFGLHSARDCFFSSTEVKDALGSEARIVIAENAFTHYFNEFDTKQALDVFVFCLSEHNRDDLDGRLSMWRAYARNGNGAAIFFDTARLSLIDGSPLMLAKVQYATQQKRIDEIQAKIKQWAELIKASEITDTQLYLPVFSLFSIFTTLALTRKHSGFDEEQEWRVIYLPAHDDEGLLQNEFTYIVTDRGVEPKLRFLLEPKEGVTAPDFSFSTITERIVLGPSIATPLARISFIKMLDKMGCSDFSPKVFSSRIPFRPT